MTMILICNSVHFCFFFNFAKEEKSVGLTVRFRRPKLKILCVVRMLCKISLMNWRFESRDSRRFYERDWGPLGQSASMSSPTPSSAVAGRIFTFLSFFLSHRNDASKVCRGRLMTIEKKKWKRSKLKDGLSDPILRFCFLPTVRVNVSHCRLCPFLRRVEGGYAWRMWFHCFFVHPNISEVKAALSEPNRQR